MHSATSNVTTLRNTNISGMWSLKMSLCYNNKQSPVAAQKVYILTSKRIGKAVFTLTNTQL